MIEDPPQHQIRVNKLADAAAFFKHVASLDTLTTADKNELQRRAEALFNRFKDYKIATVTLGDMSIKDVAPIFERINSTGTPLTIVDLMRAATWSPEFDLIDSIEGILDDLASKGFSRIDKKVILRNLSSAAGGGFSADSIDQLRNHTPERLKEAVAATGEAYKRLVDFLTTEIHVPSSDVVPYSNQLTVLGEIYRRLPTPRAAQLIEIKRWFWRTSLTGYFGGWNTGTMASDLQSVAAFAEERAQDIALTVGKPNADIWTTRQFRANNAHAKLLAIVLSYFRPLDILTGAKIDTDKALAWPNAKEYHHFFPQAYLAGLKVGPNRINCLANIIMLSSASNKAISASPPSQYLVLVAQAAGPNLDAWLASNLIPRPAFDAALRDDYDAFLELRATAIHQEVLSLAGW